jgi:hypothetical protein
MIDPTTPELPAERCGNCANSTAGEGRMGEVGYVQCRFERAYEYRSAHYPCVFLPPRWIAKPGAQP